MRFPGFEGEWECNKLSTYLYENKERNRAGEFNKSDVLSVSGDCGIVNQIELLGRSFAGKSVADYHIVRAGNIVYTKSPLKEYPYGIVKYNSGKDGIVSTLYAVYHHRENVNGRFVEHYYTSPQRTNRYFKPIVRIGAKHDMKIGNNEVLDNTVFFPGLEEQNKITELLDLLDQRIAIQNKVIEDFKMLKATLSRKLLWDNPLLSKRVQLSNFGTLKNGYAFKSSEYIPESEFRIVTIANVTGEREISINNCNTIHSLPRDIQEHQKLKPNDILVSLTGNVGRVSLCNLDGCLLNQRVGLFVLNDDYLHEYIFQVLSDIRFLQSMINSGQGAAQMNIGKYDVESFFIPFSEDLNLLNKIADMLYSIDLRITQSMKDLLLLRKQKHYFLSNLFNVSSMNYN